MLLQNSCFKAYHFLVTGNSVITFAISLTKVSYIALRIIILFQRINIPFEMEKVIGNQISFVNKELSKAFMQNSKIKTDVLMTIVGSLKIQNNSKAVVMKA